ncbi:MAG TPA: LLM class flavin-dependent oxidoreductase, partial [Acidobacteria bacterium]|nr:LLM class flavin-dependent oxidoreductase [Acidobacteriota bacterium]
AQLAERGLFDMFFMADSISFWRGSLEAMSRDSHVAWIEPFTLMGALAQHTDKLGLACTATTTYDQPFFLARRFASLDLVSGGRAAWNLVTTGSEHAGKSFGFDQHIEKSIRYRSAREFAHVVRGLWNSWGDGAFVFLATVSVADMCERLGIAVERDGFETVGGYLLTRLGRVPTAGETVDVDDLTVEVLEAERRRVRKVRMGHRSGVEAVAK